MVTSGLLVLVMLVSCTESPESRPQSEPQPNPVQAPDADIGSAGDAKKGFVADIEELTTENTNFRQVLYTGGHLQLVLMSLEPGEEIGEEVHSGIDQFIRVEQGQGQAIINGTRHDIEDDDAVVVPAGARHNVVNTGDGPLRLYTVYGPPEHRDGVVRATRPEALATDDHFDGRTTE